MMREVQTDLIISIVLENSFLISENTQKNDLKEGYCF